MIKVILILLGLFLLPLQTTAQPYNQLTCITDAIFFEAVREPPLGRQLVYHSIINRAKDPHWKANKPCSVVYQKSQYSFTLLPITKLKKFKAQRAELYTLIEKEVLTYVSKKEPIGFIGVNHYLRCDIRHRVKWWRNMKFLGAVGAHCFYKGY
jgi:Cell Wall Hydrolase